MKKSSITKNNILNAAIQLFSTNGYRATSTKDIASLATTSEASLFKYFHSKDGLFHEIIINIINELKSLTINQLSQIHIIKDNSSENSNFTLYESLSKIIENRIAFVQIHHTTLKVIFQEALINPSLKNMILDTIWPEINETLTTIFTKAINAKEINYSKTTILVSSYISLFCGPVIAFYLSNDDDFVPYETIINEHFQLFYDSIKLHL